MIPLAVTARNEEKAIGSCLESLLIAIDYAETRLPLSFDLFVVLDDCTDHTGEIARSFSRVRTIESSGGLVEAQRTAVRPAPFLIFSDADVVVEPQSLYEVCRIMLDCPEVQVSYAAKAAMPPQRRGLLAQAVYAYNRDHGYLTPRRYFLGRFFAIRHWHIPTVAELQSRLSRLPEDRFYVYERGVVVDDIYLSRWILHRHGREAIREATRGRVWYRPPETFNGVYTTYKRMRHEIERLNVIFPETKPIHRRDELRRHNWDLFRRLSWRDRWLWRLFQGLLVLCAIRYEVERFYYRYLSREKSIAWDVVTESKEAIPVERGSPSSFP